MKRNIIIGFLIIAVPLYGQQLQEVRLSDSSQSNFREESNGALQALKFFLKISSEVDSQRLEKVTKEINLFCQELAQKIDKQSYKKTIKQIFYQVHRKYLKRYQLYSSFEQTMNEGLYDCVSGTTLYAVILEKLGFTYEIKETPFHVYLLVKTEEGKFLIESTNPLEGLVVDEDKVSDLELYYTMLPKQEGESITFNNVIDLKQLAGLQYYNEAVTYFNTQKYDDAAQKLHDALNYYQSDRIMALLQLTASLPNK
jgi:hypothetical protein